MSDHVDRPVTPLMVSFAIAVADVNSHEGELSPPTCEDSKLAKKIGRGDFSTVYKGRCINNRVASREFCDVV